MNIHYDPQTRKGLYGSPNIGIKQYRTGSGEHLKPKGKEYRKSYSAKPRAYSRWSNVFTRR